MPVYTFRCEDTGQVFEVHSSIRNYDPDAVRSPFTGSANVTRLIDSVNVVSTAPGTPNTTALDTMGNEDPKGLARSMRRLAEESGQKTSNAFDEVVKNLEAGQRPADLKQSGMSVNDV